MLTHLTPGQGVGAWRVLLVLRLLLAAFFVFLAVKNLSGDLRMVEDFRRWGYSDGFRRLVAVSQLVGAAALLVPALTFAGAALLACLLIGAIVTHLRFDPPGQVLTAVVCLLLLLPLLWSYRPGRLR
jgi:putative oxidoreductase